MSKKNIIINFKSTNTPTTPNNVYKNQVMKTSYRPFANAIKDFAEDLVKIVKKDIVPLPSSCYTSYSLSYLITKSLKHPEFRIENISSRKKYQNGMCFDCVYGFDYRLDIEDCDIVLRVDNKKGRLYIGGVFATSLHCPNGAFIHILKELHKMASELGVAA